jgi:hypothetical protein
MNLDILNVIDFFLKIGDLDKDMWYEINRLRAMKRTQGINELQ